MMDDNNDNWQEIFGPRKEKSFQVQSIKTMILPLMSGIAAHQRLVHSFDNTFDDKGPTHAVKFPVTKNFLPIDK